LENKKNRKLFNIIMVAAIAVAAVAGILTVGAVKGWFSNTDESLAVAEKVSGIVSVERGGVSFELEEDTALKAGDRITTNEKAGLVIKSADNIYELAENSSVILTEPKDDAFNMEVTGGEIFVTLNDGEKFGHIEAQDTFITAEGTVFSVNVQTGSMGVNVFEGKVKAVKEKQSFEAEAGQGISAVGDKIEVIDLMAQALNQFNIDKAIEAGKTHKLCFSEEELKKVLEEREKESAESDKEDKNDQRAGEKGSGEKTGDSGKSTASAGNNTGSGKGDGEDGGKNNGGSKTEGSSSGNKPKYDYSCTIEIRCDTILNNMENLEPGKEGYVPSSGTILKRTSVGFNDGETVFDVLKRVCKEKGIQMESSWTPAYGSSYIESINHIYEFDCGPQSGWMYKVNGWFPNYGCSSYNLKDGDVIVWLYTCEGLGADVGGSMNW